MGRTRNGREPTPEEKENEAIDKFLDETWGPTMDRLNKLFIDPEANLKKAQARSNKGEKGKDGTNGANGERGARGDRGAQGERASAESSLGGASAGAGTKSYSPQWTNVSGTILQVSATGARVSITGYKFGLMAWLTSATLVDNFISCIWGGKNAYRDRTCGKVSKVLAKWWNKSALNKQKSALRNNNSVLNVNK